MIAIGITGLVMVAVAEMMFLSARSNKAIFAQSRTRQARMMAIDQIRYRLANALIGSVEGFNQTNADDEEAPPLYHGITFTDPTQANVTSSFEFVPDPRIEAGTLGRNDPKGTLVFDNDVDDATDGVVVARGPVDVTFQIEEGEVDPDQGIFSTLVQLRVVTTARVRYGEPTQGEDESDEDFEKRKLREVDTQDGFIKIYLRNAAQP